MCGIGGLFIKDAALEPRLGELVAAMLVEMSERGPDSAGIAFYRNPADAGSVKLVLFSGEESFDWAHLAHELEHELGDKVTLEVRASHAIMAVHESLAQIRHWLHERHPDLRLMSAGTAIEIFKEKGLPRDVVRRFRLGEIAGSHAIGHTRMATESAVTTEHSHPFSTGMDLCLVHNGSLSNHNRLRQVLRREGGIEFQTDNDSEVAAGYLTWRMGQGASLHEALEAGIADLDGFYTFCVGTKDGFAVLRDPIACKHAVLAETDDWVAMATEYRAIARLPGADGARVWEPAPGQVYSWGRA
jgi:methylamine---glutamate N-methyltransferase subunit A